MPDDAEDARVDGPGAPVARTSARSAGFRTALLVGLLVVLLASAASVAYLYATRPVRIFGVQLVQGQQAALQGERNQVMSVAEQFMLRINTYGPDDLVGDQMPSYRKLVEQVITPKFAADFDKNVPAAEATVKQAGVARTAQVYSAGVSTIDSDSATALVAGSFTQSYPDTPGGGGSGDASGASPGASGSSSAAPRVQTDPAPFRVTVQLVKIRGTWLVDDFAPVADDPSDDSSGDSSGDVGEGSGDLPSTTGSPGPSGPTSGGPSSAATSP